MADDTLVHLLRTMLYTGLLLLLPPVGIALITGLVIGLLQAITSIQEQTLSFVPKIISVAMILIFLGGWMLRVLVTYAVDLYTRLPEWGAL